MNRLLAAVGLSVLLAGCSGAVQPSQQAPSAWVPTSTPTASQTASPTTASPTTASSTATQTSTPSRSPSPVTWPKGIVAYPVGTSGSPLPYLEYLPSGYGVGSPRPLLVFLHGVDEEADGSEASLHKILGLGIPHMIADGSWPSKRPFVVLMPQEPVAKSSRCDFGTDIDSFLDFAVDQYRIDKARIYLTGISCGAIGVLDYLAGAQERRVAATVPISSAPYMSSSQVEGVRGGCAIARTPTWFFHGALDDIVPVHYAEDAVTDLHACKNPPPKDVKLTVYPDADHDAWTRTYDGSAGHDVFAWLLKHELD